jgi:FixJ family two-component response regulator
MIEPKLYVVDDDPNLCTALQATFRRIDLLVDTYPSAEAFIQNFDSHRIGCLILDLRMPGMGGIKLIEWLRERRIEMPVIVLSGHGNIPAVVESMKLGAVEFLEKPAEAVTLITKVQQLLHEAAARSAELLRVQEIRNCFSTLTDREREMVELLADGLSSKQIADMIGISFKTVENHRSHLLAKTGAVNVASLVRMKMIAAN